MKIKTKYNYNKIVTMYMKILVKIWELLETKEK